MACAAEEDRIDLLLDRFQAASEKIMRAHAQCGIEVMLSHDDIAMATGLCLSPPWLRRHLLPRYRQLWAPLRERGIPVMFVSDGDYGEVARDLVDAGADGLFVDAPCMDLPQLAEQCGRDKIYFTGPSPALLTTGTPRDVRAEIARLVQIARDLPRFFFHMPGGWVHNMPTENVQMFYDAARELGRR